MKLRTFGSYFLAGLVIVFSGITLSSCSSFAPTVQATEETPFVPGFNPGVPVRNSLMMVGEVERTPASDSVTDDDTPVVQDKMEGEQALTGARLWKASNFKTQDSALGYNKDAFSTPKGLEKNVQFWIDVYTRYTTDQGVLHDSENIDMIYEVIDFTAVSRRRNLNAFQKEKMRLKMVKEGKEHVIQILRKLQAVKDPSNLSAEEKRIWEYYAKSNDPKKFAKATDRSRLRFQLGQRDRFIQGMYFSGRYLEDFEKIFRDAGLPIELTRIPFVESSFNVLARSKVGASGLWQIMPYTMKPYMKRDLAIDLRNHPIEATKLAAKLFRQNYRMLESWPLAVTGYNHGPTGVLKMTKKYQTRELGELVENVQSRKSFGFASQNFYASFLAALEVEKNAPKYFGSVVWSAPMGAVHLKVTKPLKYKDLLRFFDGDDLRAQVFNPHITTAARKQGRPIPKGVIISIPDTKQKVAETEELGEFIPEFRTATVQEESP